MKISVVTPTFRREDLLARCVQSVLSQQVDAEIEYTVVNDAGEPLQPAAWMDDPRVRVVNTFRAERCNARNAGAALSSGEWLYFLDDDDYALPGAFAALLDVAQNPDTAFVYGGYEVFDETKQETTTVQPEVAGDIAHLVLAGEWTPLQATWFRRSAFLKAGCFDPLFIATEDVDLVRRVGLLGPVAGTRTVVAVVRINHPQTTSSHHNRSAEYWSRGTDKCLGLPQTFGQVARLTSGSPYWRGRLAREYIGSAARGLKTGGVAIAGSRLVAASRLSLWRNLSPAFWRGMRRRPL